MEEPQRESCEKCEATTGEFKKVLELVDSGLCVYRKCGKYNQSKPQSPRSETFIIQNNKSKELMRSDYIKDLSKLKTRTRCCKCQPDIQKALNYLKTVNVIREEEVIGICPTCQNLKNYRTCKKCNEIVKRFLLRKATEGQEKYDTWVKKVEALLQSILDTAELRRPGIIDNSKYLRELKKLLREPKEARDVNIEAFPPIEKRKYGFRDGDPRYAEYDHDKGKYFSDPHYAYAGRGLDLPGPSKRYGYDFERVRYAESEHGFDARRHYGEWGYDEFEPRRGYADQSGYRPRPRNTDFKTSCDEMEDRQRQRWEPDFEPRMYRPISDRKKDWTGPMTRAEIEDRLRQKWDPYNRNYPAFDESDHDFGTRRAYPGKGIQIHKDQRPFERDYGYDRGRYYAGSHRGFNRPRVLYPDDDYDLKARKEESSVKFGDKKDLHQLGKQRRGSGTGERKYQTDFTGATTSTALKSNKTDNKETEKSENSSKKKKVKNSGLDLKTIQKMNAREELIAKQRDELYAGAAGQEKQLTARQQKFLDKKDGSGYIEKLLNSPRTKTDESYSGTTSVASKKKTPEKKPPKQKAAKSSELDINNLIKKKKPTNSLMNMMKQIKIHQNRKQEKFRGAKVVKMEKPLRILKMKRLTPTDSEGNESIRSSECVITKIQSDKSDKKMIKGNEVIFVQKNLRSTPTKPLLFKVEGHCPSVDLISGSMKPYQYSEGTKSTKSTVAIKGTESNLDRASSGAAAARLKYELSNKKFIDMGWTKLPTLKTIRRVNIFQMDPVDPKTDWFSRHSTKAPILYDTCETLAEINEDGSGKLFYRNGLVALDYLKANEPPGARRHLIYNSGDLGSAPVILAAFDYLGNGVVYDLKGKVRLQFNQFEGCVIDSTIGPPGKWKWNNLNDDAPPVVRQFDTILKKKDQNLQHLIRQNEIPLIPERDEAMIEIENQNFWKAQKKIHKYKHSQIRMKALKLNYFFSLKMIDQAHVYLRFKDKEVNIKLNLGLKLNSDLKIDTNVIKIGEVVMLKDRRSIGEGSLPPWETRLFSVSEKSSVPSSMSIRS